MTVDYGINETRAEANCVYATSRTEAIGRIFQKNYRTSLNIARRILRSESESEDAVQSAYCSALRHFDTFRGEASFKTWLTRIVINRCLIVLREPWRKRGFNGHGGVTADYMQTMASPDASPEELALRKELTLAFDQAASRLNPGLRAAYSLYALSGMSMQDVATSLGLSVPAAKSRIFRARRAIMHSVEMAGMGRNLAVANRFDPEHTRQDMENANL